MPSVKGSACVRFRKKNKGLNWAGKKYVIKSVYSTYCNGDPFVGRGGCQFPLATTPFLPLISEGYGGQEKVIVGRQVHST